ncbi:MAG: phage tail protein I [Alphaproteobacteria bacterium]|nr:phage tail protein I [Alphaproteobacteria bacterium]
MSTELPTSSYLDNLPVILQQDPVIAGFLLAFERLLSGRVGRFADRAYPDDPYPDQAGIEEQIEHLAWLFAPRPGATAGVRRTPPEFLPWLARWVGLSLQDDWDDETRRRFLRAALPAWKLRGTRRGIREAVERYLNQPNTVTVYEFEDEPHFFQVEVLVNGWDTSELSRRGRAIRTLVEGLRPAHTWFSIKYLFTTMQIVDNPTADSPGVLLGVNTLLGTRSAGASS